jgi:hypothetical protein
MSAANPIPLPVCAAIERIADFLATMDDNPEWTPDAPDYERSLTTDRETVTDWLASRGVVEQSLTLAVSVGQALGECSVRLRNQETAA